MDNSVAFHVVYGSIEAMKKSLAILVLSLLPMVSFAAPLTDAQRTSILAELAVLEAELQSLEAQVATSTVATSTLMIDSIATTTPQCIPMPVGILPSSFTDKNPLYGCGQVF